MRLVIEVVTDNNKPLGNSQDRKYLSVEDARLDLGTLAVDEALALHVASRAELMALHQELGEKVQELIDAAGREELLRQALARAAQRLRSLNDHVFDQGYFTDRHGDGDVNRAVISACEEVLR